LGYESYHLDGETPNNEREFIKQRLKEGSETIVNNCGVLTTGFDEPRIETVVLNRLTKSENLFIQMAGRGSRTAVDIGKEKFILLDLYGNSVRLNRWEAHRDWQRKFESIKESKNGEAPVKLCPQCEAVVPAQAKTCPHCGFEFAKEEEEAELTRKQELVILRETTIREKAQQAMELVKTRGYKPFSALYKIVEFVFKDSHGKGWNEIENELLVGLRQWCDENKGNPKIKFNQWYKDRIMEIYRQKAGLQ
jgi:superfamily II DNA or RNA helicase